MTLVSDCKIIYGKYKGEKGHVRKFKRGDYFAGYVIRLKSNNELVFVPKDFVDLGNID